MTVLEIQSVGAPPEKHADRIVSLMLRHLAQQHAKLWETVNDITKSPHTRDGNPRAQRKLEARIKALGVNFVHLEPGKRGRYRLSVNGWTGFDPAVDRRIAADDPIPAKPWLANWHHIIEGKGHGWVDFYSRAVLYLTHHSLSRVTQRWQVRTLADLLRVIEAIGAAALSHIASSQTEGNEDTWHITPPEGIRVPFPNHSSVMVLKQHEKHKALVVTTIF
jgi:hypothetical protein